MRSLTIAATGMQAQQNNVEVISNNIANISTTGFKRRRAEFQDLIYQNLRRTGSQSADTGTTLPSGAQIGLGVRTAAVYRISEQGNLQQTENRFDLEDPRSVARLADPMLALEPLRGLVVLDEIQLRPDLFSALRVLADRPRRSGRFLVLGSAAPALLRQSAESLAGRIA